MLNHNAENADSAIATQSLLIVGTSSDLRDLIPQSPIFRLPLQRHAGLHRHAGIDIVDFPLGLSSSRCSPPTYWASVPFQEFGMVRNSTPDASGCRDVCP